MTRLVKKGGVELNIDLWIELHDAIAIDRILCVSCSWDEWVPEIRTSRYDEEGLKLQVEKRHEFLKKRKPNLQKPAGDGKKASISSGEAGSAQAEKNKKRRRDSFIDKVSRCESVAYLTKSRYGHSRMFTEQFNVGLTCFLGRDIS